MPRIAKPYIFRGWYVTKAGGEGVHKLCPVEAGLDKAEDILQAWLEKCQQSKREAQVANLVKTDSPHTVAQLIAEFLQLKEATKKRETFQFYGRFLDRLDEYFGHLEARSIELHHGSEYVLKLKKAGLAGTTINHHLRAAKGVFNYAVEAGRLPRNPWRKLDLLPEGRRKRIMTDAEFQQLVAACDKCIAYRGRISREDAVQLMKDVLWTLRYTAMRPGELRKLRWRHVHLDRNLIKIPAGEHKTSTTAKNPEDRIIPILDEVKPILAARRAKSAGGPDEPVFPNALGSEWTDDGFSRRFAKLRKRASLDGEDHNGEKLVAYSLRHTRLTEAGVEEGWAYPVLQRFAGHTKGSRVTDRYVHPDEEDILRAALEGQQRRKAPQQVVPPAVPDETLGQTAQ
jgi:integrase